MYFKAFISVILILLSGTSRALKVETWKAVELTFEDGRFKGGDIEMEVVFTHIRTGNTLSRPAFWDGGNTYRVRFAPTDAGLWRWRTVCPEEEKLTGLHGKIRCKKYNGTLDIYSHGFVRVTPGQKYLTYADGTPFFYLGDTHWGMYKEEMDEPGPNAGDSGAESHFKHIVDRRVEQGFTVYQSEPLGAKFKLTDGKIDEDDIPGFREADRYYQYIADVGLVHANAELFFASEMSQKIGRDEEALERLARYWVARFGAYPVLWTLAQEVDNDFYAERGDQKWYDFSCNPWVRFAEYLHKYDCYSHPLSAHQENTIYTSVTGAGVSDRVNASGGGASAFASEDVATRTGHDWWAVQWSPSLTSSPAPETPQDYWNSPYPAVNYEGRYCNLWTKDFGARAQGWISFLSGFCGYGYGVVDMWLYKSTYDIGRPSFDGVDTIYVEDKAIPWCESLEFESAVQMGYLKEYLRDVWWKLEPVFAGNPRFQPAENSAYAYARIKDHTNIFYFYNRNTGTGRLRGLNAARTYHVRWFNPRNGQYSENICLNPDKNGEINLPSKPDEMDWVLAVTLPSIN